ncbi:MAG: hypothetical protein BZY88_07115, partial [SAR202 cluster bacterium Io17-Chloro-G9]
MDKTSARPSIFPAAQAFLRQEDLPGWLIYDYRHSNPIFRQAVTPSGHVTRPCFLYVPADGPPLLMVHHVDAGKFADLGIELRVFQGREDMIVLLGQALSGTSRVAMEYSPLNLLPRVSRVDAGTVELVRSMGVEVVSSADLMQYATQRWSPQQLEDHRSSASKLGEIVNQAFQFAAAQMAAGPTEYQVAEFIRQRFHQEGLETPDGPIVATNAHSSDPHYEPTEQRSSVIRPGDWLLIDLWARSANQDDSSPATGNRSSSPLGKGGLEGGQESVFADITWVAYVGDAVPPAHQEIFDIVTGARDAALAYLKDSHQRGLEVQGWQADAVAREYISSQGYGEYFTHRLGHSIGNEVHGEAVNLDGWETRD